MTLEPGTALGSYQVLSLLGEGGMGAVYRARDRKLGREVAIKLLPARFSQVAGRRTRFEREAKLLASLNHPNIATLFGLEECEIDGERLHFLIMELVEGEELAERIGRGALPVGEAIPLFLQIAAGLEAAHGQGVIHRDLKPANLKLTAEGRIKILDFGLAKAFSEPALAEVETQPPTLNAEETRAGAILGTAAYMSPEQARGDAVSTQSDVWSFGVCLFEALSGHRPFSGDTASELLASVLRDEPEWSRLPEYLPLSIHRVLGRCLHKSPRQRLRHIGDAGLELEVAANEDTVTTSDERVRSRWPLLMTAGIALVALGFATGLWRGSGSSPPPDGVPVRRLSLDLRGSVDLDESFAISPDGRMLAFASFVDERQLIFLHDFARGQTTRLAGGVAGSMPFFSPDGSTLGYLGGANMVLVDLQTSTTRTIRLGIEASAASWTDDGAIVFSSRTDPGLFEVEAGGGNIRELLDGVVWWPQALPAGRVLYRVGRRSGEEPRLEVLDRKTRTPHDLGIVSLWGRYLPSGHLVYQTGGVASVRPFDPSTLELGPTAFPFPGNPLLLPSYTFPLAASDDGLLVFAERSSRMLRRPVVRDIVVGAVELLAWSGGVFSGGLSPDGRRLVLTGETTWWSSISTPTRSSFS